MGHISWNFLFHDFPVALEHSKHSETVLDQHQGALTTVHVA